MFDSPSKIVPDDAVPWKKGKIPNQQLLLSAVQMNPGDDLGAPDTKYDDPSYLGELGYNVMVASANLSPLLAADLSAALPHAKVPRSPRHLNHNP